MLRAHDAEGHARGRVTRASTVAEHIDPLVVDEVSANAPGRTEGRCEHADLAVPCTRDDHTGSLRHTVGAHLRESRRDGRGVAAQSHERTMLEATHEDVEHAASRAAERGRRELASTRP
jgi:hypothetical protein